MALPGSNYANPQTVTTPGITATAASPYPKPTNSALVPKPGLNTPATNVQPNAQANTPYSPNNGNPNGVHNNSPRQRRFNTRFGGGYIGNRPQEGAVLGRNGVWYGSGALTPNQVEFNEQQAANPQPSPTTSFNSGNILAQMQALLSRPLPQGGPVSMPNSGSGPVSQPSPMMQQNWTPPPAPSTSFGNNGLPLSGGGPNQPPPSYGYAPPSQVSPYPGQPLTQEGYNMNTYYGGQNPNLGRYRPPQMNLGGGWNDQGGYNYNLPNAFGPYPNFGMGPYGYGNNYG
jgi:hypothetical protein